MKVQIEITSEELNRYIQYEKLLRKNPCLNKNCITERSTCCGCTANHEWSKKLKVLNINDYKNAGVIADFAKAYVDYKEIEEECKKYNKKLNEAKKLLDLFDSQFNIILH